jgi:putative SOS response-associated peptidase YedK
VVPLTSFSEFNKAEGGDIWFAFDESRPLAFFAGIWTRWKSIRKVKEGETENDLFAFLTTGPNAVVAPIHPKAMPVVLTTREEVERWLTAPPNDALALQRRRAKDRGSGQEGGRSGRRLRTVNGGKLTKGQSTVLRPKNVKSLLACSHSTRVSPRSRLSAQFRMCLT